MQMYRSPLPSVLREPAPRASRPGSRALVIDTAGSRVGRLGPATAQVAGRPRGTGANIDATAVPAEPAGPRTW